MNYQRIYQEIISNAQNRVLKDYTERHHIVPHCQGGSDEPENLVDLTAREHFLAHWLLVKIYPKNYKLKHAFWCMASMKSKDTKERYRCSSRVFEIARKTHAEAMKGNTYMKGKKHSDETRKKIGASRKGKTHTTESRKKIGFAARNCSAETRKKLSASSKGNKNMKGKKHSAETRARMSAAKKGIKNYLFKGWYCTPKGKFTSSGEAADKNSCSHMSIYNWCKQNKPGYSFEPVQK